jgi:hypothetical protein
MVQRGEFLPVTDLPYIDALPRDHPDRDKVIETYLARAYKEGERDDAVSWWAYRMATRLYLRDLEQTWEAPYMLGRLQGRHYLWAMWQDELGHWSWRWLDAR